MTIEEELNIPENHTLHQVSHKGSGTLLQDDDWEYEVFGIQNILNSRYGRFLFQTSHQCFIKIPPRLTNLSGEEPKIPNKIPMNQHHGDFFVISVTDPLC